MPSKVETKALLDAPIEEFGKSAAAVHFQSSLSLTEFAKAHREIAAGLDKVNPNAGTVGVRGHWTALDVVDLARTEDRIDPTSGQLPRFQLANKGRADVDLKEDLEAGFNRQLRWLLVTTFESHERFLKDLYAAVGYLNPGLWRGKDIGDETLASMKEKGIEWFRTKVSRADCPEIRKHLRSQLPQVDHYEKTNWIHREHTDYRFWVGVIEEFRHAIVHANGEIDEPDLWKGASKSTGYSLTGNSSGILAKKASVEQFCESIGGRYNITLFDAEKLASGQRKATKRFHDLFHIIVNYNCMIYSVVCKYFGVKRMWER